MGTQIINLAPTTELDAVNVVLASVGERPVTSLVSPPPDVELILNQLRTATRELQARGWRFNTRANLRIQPATTSFVWNEIGGGTTTLAVFVVPAGLADFKPSRNAQQQGELLPDLVARLPEQYTPNTAEVFYDRARSRDGFPAAERTALWIDATFWEDFERMPEVARRYVTVLAARRYQQQAAVSGALAGFNEADEQRAWAAFLEDQAVTPAVFSDSALTSELQAVNDILAAVKRPAVASLDALHDNDDAAVVLNALRQSARAVQARGWRFNTEVGLEVMPTGTVAWPEIGGGTTTLNVFLPPANLLSWSPSKTTSQQGTRTLDAALRPSKVYTVNSLPVNVFYDREKNRDGFRAAERDRLFIDATFFVAWAFTPEAFRRYVLTMTKRALVSPDNPNLARFLLADEGRALADLEAAEGSQDQPNIFDNADYALMSGLRPRMASGASFPARGRPARDR